MTLAPATSVAEIEAIHKDRLKVAAAQALKSSFHQKQMARLYPWIFLKAIN